VVWWDPNALDLDRKPPFGVRREDLIVKDVPRHIVADGRGEYDRWVLARADAREAGSQPSLRVQTVREAAEAAATKAGKITIVDVRDPTEAERAGGVAFGALVHELLARAQFDASAESLVDLAAVQARLLELTAEDARAAAGVAGRVLGLDLMKRAHTAERRGACRRETPVTIRGEDGTLIEGTVDLAFEESGTWTIVDFKTDRELAARTPGYVRQVQLYADAVKAATGAPADAVILQI
jgi:ATP-dependent exoDNAse (exonuclease V) beta subunit